MGRPELVGYWDGADEAYDGIVFGRWRTNQDFWHTCLIARKARVTPSSGLTTPLAERCGLVLLCRLMDAVVSAISVKPSRITLIGDSTCTLPLVRLTVLLLEHISQIEWWKL